MNLTSTSVSIILSAGDNLTTSLYPPQLTKTFPYSYTSVKDRIGLEGLTMYYSWYNCTDVFNNLFCSYIWTDGVTYPVSFLPGFYQIADLYGVVAAVMLKNGHYLVDGNGNNVFYISFIASTTYYAVSLSCIPTPTVLPVNYTNPANMVLSGKAPQFIVPANNNWGLLVGFTAGTYPATVQTSTFIVDSNLIPQISPITVINVLCDWVNDSRFSSRPNCIGSFSPDKPFASLLTYKPYVLALYDVIPKRYSDIKISFVDQNFNPLVFQDYNLQINLTLQQQNL